MLSLSLVVFGGLVLLLGSLVLLVVSSGINDRFDAPPQPSAKAGNRDEVTLSADYADYRGVTWGHKNHRMLLLAVVHIV
jgi:hypothetical protein